MGIGRQESGRRKVFPQASSRTSPPKVLRILTFFGPPSGFWRPDPKNWVIRWRQKWKELPGGFPRDLVRWLLDALRYTSSRTGSGFLFRKDQSSTTNPQIAAMTLKVFTTEITRLVSIMILYGTIRVQVLCQALSISPLTLTVYHKPLELIRHPPPSRNPEWGDSRLHELLNVETPTSCCILETIVQLWISAARKSKRTIIFIRL